MIKKLIRSVVAGVGISLAAGSASAAITQLGASLDASGSVSFSDFQLQLQGWADAISSLPTDGSVEVTVVQFGTAASLEVAPTVIDSVATRTAVASAVTSIAKAGGGTPIDAGINVLAQAMTGSANFLPGTNTSVINLATDGSPNSQSAAIAAAQAAQAAGIDALTIEAVGFANTTAASQLVFNPTCSVFTDCGVVLPANSLPPNPVGPLGSAWVLPVTSFADFSDAISAKVTAIVDPDPVPAPGVLALFAIGLAGLGASTRRNRSAAA